MIWYDGMTILIDGMMDEHAMVSVYRMTKILGHGIGIRIRSMVSLCNMECVAGWVGVSEPVTSTISEVVKWWP